jgi:hypothetical protein
MKKLLANQNWKSIVTTWVLILGLITGVQLVKVNLDNRSKAANEDVGVSIDLEEKVMCGSSDGKSVSFRPIDDLCVKGSPIWIDSVANDGGI